MFYFLAAGVAAAFYCLGFAAECSEECGLLFCASSGFELKDIAGVPDHLAHLQGDDAYIFVSNFKKVYKRKLHPRVVAGIFCCELLGFVKTLLASSPLSTLKVQKMTNVIYVDELNPTNIKGNIRVRVVCMFDNINFHKRQEMISKDIICVDEKGNKVHASIKKSLIKKFECISEYGIFSISNFGLIKYLDQYRHCSHPHKVTFCMNTIVKEIVKAPISRHSFEFIDFDVILSKDVDLIRFGW